MKTSLGLLDALFGKKVTVELPDGSGGQRRITVTEKWLQKMIAEKRMREVPESSVVVFLIGPHGEKTATLQIGEDIDQDTVDEFRDPDTGALYGGYAFENGQENTFLLQKRIYDEMEAQMADMRGFIDSEVDRALGRSRDPEAGG